MASITLTTAAVAGERARYIKSKANATLAQGQFVYRNASRKMALAQANSVNTDDAVGMVAQSVTANAPCDVQNDGQVVTTGLTTGTFYVLSDTVAGAIMPVADLTSGDRVVLIGYAISATILELLIRDTGVAL